VSHAASYGTGGQRCTRLEHLLSQRLRLELQCRNKVLLRRADTCGTLKIPDPKFQRASFKVGAVLQLLDASL
jgi:hypothetical protein